MRPTELRTRVFDHLRHPAVRLPLLLALHVGLFSVIYAVAFFARLDFVATERQLTLFWSTLGPVILSKLAVFYFGGHFHGWWRYVTFADLRDLLKVTALSMVVVAFVDYFLLPFSAAIPRGSILLDALGTIVVVGGLRCSWRFADEVLGGRANRLNKQPALLIGTDHLTGQLAAQINSSQAAAFRIVGLISISKDFRRKSRLGGIPVVGNLEKIAETARHYDATRVLVTAGALDGGTLRELTNRCNNTDLEIKVLPKFEDAMAGTMEIPLRPLNIEDLLRRDPVELDTENVQRLVSGRRVLVTGAGGSIGSEICRQCIRFCPSELILLGRGENRIHAIWQELKPLANDLNVNIRIEIGDITDQSRMEGLFGDALPEIVFHAAAHKHVPLMEMHPGEAVKNNVYGTKVIGELANKHGAGHFVMVSTDKAVNPTSIMGCTKQLAERIVYDLAQDSDTKFAIVRFGNVLGSAGSVIPIFQKQIRSGGPITITDPEMTRYFMSIPEASQLVIQAAAQCRGGEIFVLDMGKPVKIVQLAEDLVTLSGLPKGSIEFVFTGIRDGEKLYEELYFDEETTIATTHPKVRAAYPREFQGNEIGSSIQNLIVQAFDRDPKIRESILDLIPSYQPTPRKPSPADRDIPLHPVPTT